ncbi:tail fiber assembly protein, partial [Salmonella enterica]|nr:tail fiber assembly protein [Salmonella enterica]
AQLCTRLCDCSDGECTGKSKILSLMATDDEKAQIDEWKKYRVLVNRVDTTNPDWPKMSAN